MDKVFDKVYVSGLKFLDPLSNDEIYTTLVEEGKKLSGADWGTVYVEKREKLIKVYTSSPLLLRIRPRKKGFVASAWMSKKPFLYNASQTKELRETHKEFKELGVKSSLIIPISYGGESMGLLSLHSHKDHNFNQQDIKVLLLFCSLAFMCIRKTQLYNEARKALELRDLFISIAAHELKTPLTAASLYGDLLRTKLSESNSPEAKWSAALSQEVARLTKLINELLQIDLIKAEKLAYSWQRCSVEGVITEAVKHFHAQYPFRKILFKNNTRKNEDLVVGDFEKLLQAISNLLNNAAKYSPINTPITIELEAKNSGIGIWVIDEGAGIPQKDIPRLFEQFYKGQNSLHEGMGLGLYLIKNIIDHHKGKLQVYSELNKGTTVEIFLPKG